MMRNVTKSWWIENGEMSRKMLPIDDNLTLEKLATLHLKGRAIALSRRQRI